MAEFEAVVAPARLDIGLLETAVCWAVDVMSTVLVRVVVNDADGVTMDATLEEFMDDETTDETAGADDETTGADDETAGGGDTTGEDKAAAEDDVAKISFCAPSLNPQLLLYAGLLGLPLRSEPLTAMLFPSA